MTSRFPPHLLPTRVVTSGGRSLIEERYQSVRKQVPIVYLLAFVNMSMLEISAVGRLAPGINVPTFIAICGLVRAWQWFAPHTRGMQDPRLMTKRLHQAFWFAAAMSLAVSGRCLYLLQTGDAASDMSVILFGGLTGFGFAYGLIAVPAAAWLPLILIIGPMSAAALLADSQRTAGAAVGLIMVAILTARLVGSHSRQFSRVVRSRSAIAVEQHKAVVAATTDCLTGLPNRRAFVAALDAACLDPGEGMALAILDLDRFKAVNDTFGHAIGDRLLVEVARRLVRAAAPLGIVARLGGDEFGVLFDKVHGRKEAQSMGSEILRQVNGPASIDGREFAIATSCGVGLSRKNEAPSPSRLLADADLALYEAKDNPGGGAAIFELKMEAPRRRRAEIERALRLPGVEDNLGVVFQPIFDLRTGQVVANEALARWSDPELGAVSPSEFVPIAEQLNLIHDINCHLMAIAFEAARDWPPEIKLAFNLSAIQLCSSGSAKTMLTAAKRAGLRPERLQAEVTETALLADFDRARANLAELKRAGATIVLDDFGAGYASIGYLRELRFDQIKLDGSLVTAAQYSADGKRLLRAVVGLCEGLGVSTVAEHVESAALLALVTELGCTAGQGFWLARPLPAVELTGLFDPKVFPLRRRIPRRAA